MLLGYSIIRRSIISCLIILFPTIIDQILLNQTVTLHLPIYWEQLGYCLYGQQSQNRLYMYGREGVVSGDIPENKDQCMGVLGREKKGLKIPKFCYIICGWSLKEYIVIFSIKQPKFLSLRDRKLLYVHPGGNCLIMMYQ